MSTNQIADADARLIGLARFAFINGGSLPVRAAEASGPLRGYLLADDGWVMTFDPRAVSVDDLWRVVHRFRPPLEVWILENDAVIDFREVQAPPELS